MPYFERDHETRLYYEIIGAGEAVLLVHGFMGSATTEFNSLIPWLSKKYQLILPDLRGYGRSTPKPRRYEADFYRQDADDMRALLDHLHIQRPAVMGYSDGGEVALWLAVLMGDQVRGAITWGASGLFDPSIRPGILAMMSMNWRTPALDQLHGAAHIQPMTTRWMAAMLGMVDAGGDVTFSRAGEIQCPVLMLLGDRDQLNPVEPARQMADAIPQGQFSLYKKTGHPIHLERPRRFRREVLRFLRQVSSTR